MCGSGALKGAVSAQKALRGFAIETGWLQEGAMENHFLHNEGSLIYHIENQDFLLQIADRKKFELVARPAPKRPDSGSAARLSDFEVSVLELSCLVLFGENKFANQSAVRCLAVDACMLLPLSPPWLEPENGITSLVNTKCGH